MSDEGEACTFCNSTTCGTGKMMWEVWRNLFANRIYKLTGMKKKDCLYVAEANQEFFDDLNCPVESAEVELSYWDD